MRTFAQKPKATQQTTSAKSTIPGRAHFGQSREVNSILHLQRTIGNQAVQRLLEVNTGDVKGDSTTTEIARFGHDFSRVRVHGSAPALAQPKLKLNRPGDVFEQEADRVADTVMRMSRPPIESAAGIVSLPIAASQTLHRTDDQHVRRQPLKGKEYAIAILENEGETEMAELLRRSDDEALESLLQDEEQAGSTTLQAKKRPEYAPGVRFDLDGRIQALRGSGQPLPHSTRMFFEPLFGYDFSEVRMHTSARAAKVARAVHAQAFTIGKDIVFGAGYYDPSSEAGKRLLAHELTHAVQQGLRHPYGDKANPVTVGQQAQTNALYRYTKADCDAEYETCCDGCRRLPNRTKADKARRALCWSGCMAAYAACLASSAEALTFYAIVAAIVLAPYEYIPTR
jgi:hypothetical protein